MTTDLELIADAMENRALRHDCAERRHTAMHRILIALDNIAADADAMATGQLAPAVGYDIARRARKAAAELEDFKARDLLPLRRKQD